MNKRFLFVGEEPSPRALEMGVDWLSEALCAGTLRRALRAAGIDPDNHTYWNWFTADEEDRVQMLDWAARHKITVVALGNKVFNALCSSGLLNHHCRLVRLTHPAARGKIRKTEMYQKHVREVLAS